MGNLKLDTVDDVSRATTPNALRAASNADLDHIFNVARGHLRKTDSADLRQTASSIEAVIREQTRRSMKWERIRSWVALVVSIAVAVIALWNRVDPPKPKSVVPAALQAPPTTGQ